jgi:hypothetical protein
METHVNTGQSARRGILAPSPFPELQIAASEYRNTDPDLIITRWRLEKQQEDQAAVRREARGRSFRRLLVTTVALVCLAVIAVAVYAARVAKQYGSHTTALAMAVASYPPRNGEARIPLRF